METPNVWLLAVGFALMVVAVVALWRGRRLWAESGLPAGEVVYSDAGTWYPTHDTLVALDLKLMGKPDYLIKQANGRILPVEVKSRLAPSQPFESHVLQVAAYCLLVEQNYGIRPTHGILQYQDKAFSIGYTAELEENLLELLAQMRQDMLEPELDRDHEEPRRCARCGFRDYCDQRLA